jgi:hypothetical protein
MQTSKGDSYLGHLLADGGEDEQVSVATRVLPLQDLHPAQRGGSTPLSRSPAAGGRDDGDGAQQRMAAVRAREGGGSRSRSTVVKGIGLTG